MKEAPLGLVGLVALKAVGLLKLTCISLHLAVSSKPQCR
jgi:hypothetical protein